MKGNSAGQQSDQSVPTQRERSVGERGLWRIKERTEGRREAERDTEQYLNDTRH